MVTCFSVAQQKQRNIPGIPDISCDGKEWQPLRILCTTRKVNAYLFVNTFQLGNCWTDFDKTWYELYAVGGYPIAALLNFMQLVTPLATGAQIWELTATLVPLNMFVGSWNFVWLQKFKKYADFKTFFSILRGWCIVHSLWVYPQDIFPLGEL
jgi:hypothetical protein